MSFRLKKIIVFFLIYFLFSTIITKAQDKDIYAIVTKITTQKDQKPEVYVGNENAEILENDIITSSITIITKDSQKIELVLYKKNLIHSYIVIQENTDLKFNLDQEKATIDIDVKYGAVRISLKTSMNLLYKSETVKCYADSSEFGVISKINNNTLKREGYFIVFNGKIKVTPIDDDSKAVSIERFQIAEFIDKIVSQPKKLEKIEFDLWKNNMIFSDKNIISDKDVYLEKINFTSNQAQDKSVIEKQKPQEIIKEQTEEITEENNQEKSPKQKKDISNKDKILSGLLSFRLSAVGFNNTLGIMALFDPVIPITENFQFGFYLPFYFIPYEANTGNWMMKINESNNEWSFGTDQGSSVGKIVYDVFADTLLKINNISFVSKSLIVKYGDVFEIDDLFNFSLVSYSTDIFKPGYRSSSFLIDAKIPWFKIFFYAEDILPQGLYGIDAIFMTPFSSNKLRFKISCYSDFYNAIKFEKEESFFPTQYNTSISFEPFNVNFMRVAIFASGGILVPFSINSYSNTSLFGSVINSNPYVIASNIAGSTGFLYRILGFTFQTEFIFDSGINKVGLFDNLYMFKRRIEKEYIEKWLNKIDNTSSIISEYNFGFRTMFNVKIKKYAFFDISYKITFPDYYDKIIFKLEIDSLESMKVRFTLFALFELEYFGLSITNLENFRKNNISGIGFSISPINGIDIIVKGSILPRVYNTKDPWYDKMIFDISIVTKPYLGYLKAKKTDKNSNNEQ